MSTNTDLLVGVVGSTAYGLAREGSDVDTLGVFVAPTLEIAGLDWNSDKESHVSHEPDITMHEAGKFIRLLLKGNPSIVELLFLDEYLIKTDYAQFLINIRKSILNPAAIKASYGGFVAAQIKRLQRNESNGGGYAKPARHALRFTRQGAQLLTTGTMSVRLPDPETYFAFDTMALDDVVSLLTRELNIFDNLTEPFALDSFDRSHAVSWLTTLRKAYL